MPPTSTLAPPPSISEPVKKKRPDPKPRATAETMAKKQREIAVSEFFAKNRHLLGFDNPGKALLTTVKEAVDNSLDACEEAGILPDLFIGVYQLSETRFRVTIPLAAAEAATAAPAPVAASAGPGLGG